MSEEIKTPREWFVDPDENEPQYIIPANPEVKVADNAVHVIEYSAFLAAVEALKKSCRCEFNDSLWESCTACDTLRELGVVK